MSRHLIAILTACFLLSITSAIIRADETGSSVISISGIEGPFGVATGPDGMVYICETLGHRILRWNPSTNQLSQYAGTGKAGYTGDGGKATVADLNEPYEIQFDTEGDLYFVDRLAHVVRKIDTQTGTISTVAGSGSKGFSGDGGPATQAQLAEPHSICFDGQEQLYICDIGNHRVRRVDPQTGIISTFAGTGERKPTPNESPIDGTPLNGPRALAFDGGNNLILALREGNALLRIDRSTNTIFHVAGTGKPGYSGDGGDARKAQLAGPKGVAIDPKTILFADTESHTIRTVDRIALTIKTIMGDGRQGDALNHDPRKCRLDRPHGVEITPDGWIHVGDTNNNRVLRFRAR